MGLNSGCFGTMRLPDTLPATMRKLGHKKRLETGDVSNKRVENLEIN